MKALALVLLVVLAGCSSGGDGPDGAGPLEFPAKGYVEKHVTVGKKQVTYRFYDKITYVGKPADAADQSLSVAAPVKIDGSEVSPWTSPVLLDIPVGDQPAAKQPGEVPLAADAGRALADGWVVVTAGARGRDVPGGAPPAAIVDLKAAVRYLRSNQGRMPGNTARIVAEGTGTGGALAWLLGASGDSELYDPYLRDVGAADASDTIFGVAAYSPATDVANTGEAYAFLYGGRPNALADRFRAWQAALGLTGVGGYGPLTADNYKDYLVKTYLQPAAAAYLTGLPETKRTAYLMANPWLGWSGGQATFTYADYLRHLGDRVATPPVSGPADRGGTAALMDPLAFAARRHEGRARHWFLRTGAYDTGVPLSGPANLAAAFTGLGDRVDAAVYWDAGPAADVRPDEFRSWAARAVTS